MDDKVAESEHESPREALTPFLNLSLGDQHSAQAGHAAPKKPLLDALLISISSTRVQFTNEAKNHYPA